MEAGLTFCSHQAPVVPDWTAVFKDKDCDGHNSQTHDEHHHPDCRTVGLCRDRGHRGDSQSVSEEDLTETLKIQTSSVGRHEENWANMMDI